MCGPASLALMAPGMAMSAYGSIAGAKQTQDAYNKAQTAENDVLNSTLAKEKGFQDKNSATMQDLVSKFAPGAQGAALTNAEGARDATIDSAAPPPIAIPSGEFTPGIIKQVNAQKMLDGFQYATDLAKAKAKVGSYSDAMGGNARAITDAGGNIDMQNNFAKAVNAMLPDQQQLAAASVYTPPSGGPALMTGLGNLMTGLGASGKGASMMSSIPGLG